MKKSLIVLFAFFLFVISYGYSQDSSIFFTDIPQTEVQELNPAPEAGSSTKSLGDFYFKLIPVYSSLRYGVHNELVYVQNPEGKSVKLSELNWQQHWLVSQGIELGIGWKGLELTSVTTAAIPGNTGRMLDSDWENVATDQRSSLNGGGYVPAENCLKPELAALKTCYSQSTNLLKYSFTEDVEISLKALSRSLYDISVLAAYTYGYSYQEAHGLEQWQGSYTSSLGGYYLSYDEEGARYRVSDETIVPIKLEKIDMIGWVGAGINLRPLSSLQLNFKSYVSPVCYIQSKDEHVGSGTYIDIMTSYFCAAKLNAGMEWQFLPHSKLLLDFCYSASREIPGVTYTSNGSMDNFFSKASSTSACSFEYLDVTLGLRMNF